MSNTVSNVFLSKKLIRRNRTMNLELDKHWFEKRIEMEDDLQVGAGLPMSDRFAWATAILVFWGNEMLFGLDWHFCISRP